MSEQQKGSLENQIHALQQTLHAFIEDLRNLYEQYMDDPDLQIEQAYLGDWFPDQIAEFEEWSQEADRAAREEEFRTSTYFFAALNEYDSLGRALDADLESVDAERAETARGRMRNAIELSHRIRDVLRGDQDA